MKIKRLDTEYKTGGFTYKLMMRTENFACYRQLSKEGELVGFEIFRIPIRPPETIGEREYPLRETPPSSSSWGESAWSPRFDTQEEVLQTRLNNLQKEYDEKLRANQR